MVWAWRGEGPSTRPPAAVVVLVVPWDEGEELGGRGGGADGRDVGYAWDEADVDDGRWFLAPAVEAPGLLVSPAAVCEVPRQSCLSGACSRLRPLPLALHTAEDEDEEDEEAEAAPGAHAVDA